MGFRLKTSKKTEEIFEEIGYSSNLKPFILSKLAISLSLNSSQSIDEYLETDQNGLELNRQTIMAEYDDLYKVLIEQNLGRSITDDEFYPYYSKKHLDRGAIILRDKIRYFGNYDLFFKSIIKGNDAI